MKQIFFFIGTEAELIKVFPVILECQNKGSICNIIASGQNDLKKSRIVDFIKLNGTFIELSKEESITKSAVGLFIWFFQTKQSAVNRILQDFNKKELINIPMVVHGDTVSTLMGALIGKALKMQVCHVEAGLRSHNLFNPFPEEIDRLLTSRIARVHFAPGVGAVSNLVKAKGKVIDTEYNTILDSLSLSKEISIATDGLGRILNMDYFVFVMHRQENLMNKEFVNQVLEKIKEVAQNKRCVLILHKITEKTLNDIGILDEIAENENFVLLPRVDYFDFMKLLNKAKFVITDGGSNQEELHYMGKPCLIMRKNTERNEGIGTNAVMFGGNIQQVVMFANEYERYSIPEINAEKSPTHIIVNELLRMK